MAKEASAPNATISDTTKKTALSIDALTVTSCDPDTMKTDALTTQSILVQTPLHKNRHPHPSESPHQRLLESCASLPIGKTVIPPRHQTESEKGDERERNLNGKDSKTMSTEVYPNKSRKWTKNTTKSSRISPLPLTTKSSTTKPPTKISMANLATPMIFDFQWNFKYNRGVMLRFSPLLCTISHPSYLLFRSLRMIPIIMDH